ncbi:MAG: cell envelope integrity protein CreD [Kiloniellales bacterium]|nr:cell envelope integrity protein CreD [Kiloniellales bacterium]
MSEQSANKPSIFDAIERHAFALKVILLLAVVGASLWPLGIIRGLIEERQTRQDRVIAEITASWGGAQRIVGPVLVLPFGKPEAPAFADGGNPGSEGPSEDGGENGRSGEAYLLPERLKIDAKLDAEVRSRSIYQALLYTADTKLTASFKAPDLEALRIRAPEQVDWDRARLEIYVADLSAVQAAEEILWNDRKLPLYLHRRLGKTGAVLAANLPTLSARDDWAADMKVDIVAKGSGSLSLRPLGGSSQISLRADWPHPGFGGAFLPAASEVTAEGFNADWRISRFGSKLPQQWRSDSKPLDCVFTERSGTAAVVSLVDPVDHYLKSERAVKYGTLFVALVVGAVFLFELRTRTPIHVVQYGMVAVALALFFLLLLSLSELLGFDLAYWIAVVLSVALVTAYLAKILASLGKGAIVAALQVAVYTYLFTTLLSEEHALLLGAFLLFGALAAVMFATRNLDWYSLGAAVQRRASTSQAGRSDQA